jgi:branched-chain amino acid transport system substrate-binding protein
MQLEEQGIKISTAAQDIASLKTMDSLIGMSGFSIYYHTLPDNEVNDWLVEEHKKKFDGEIPDLFTAGGMTAAISIVEALKKTEGDKDVDGLISTMENMEFETPKGTMKFRAEDHQALQSLYAVTLEEQEGVDHPVPVLIRELNMEETEPPIRNGE